MFITQVVPFLHGYVMRDLEQFDRLSYSLMINNSAQRDLPTILFRLIGCEIDHKLGRFNKGYGRYLLTRIGGLA